MSEKDKGFSFRKLFFRDVEDLPKETEITKEEVSNRNSSDDFISDYASASSKKIQSDPTLVEDFVQRLQNLINQNNQPGFDFLEFTESLFEEKHNPDPDVYKTVFRIAQKMDKSLTPSRLIESAFYYRDLVQNAADSEISKGETKKHELLAEKENEKNNLDNDLKDTRTKIQQLMQQIQDFQNREVEVKNQLFAIDNKYGTKVADIEKKIDAIRNAKEQVIVSIVDIEAGIKTNLS